MIPRLEDIPGAIVHDDAVGVSIDWHRVERVLPDGPYDLDLEAIYTGWVKEWLQRIRSHWGGEYQLYESANFLILSPDGPARARNLARLGAKTLTIAGEVSGGLATKSGVGKFVCVVADEQDRYYGYLARHDGPGDRIASAGVFIGQGYAHFLLNCGEAWSQEQTFVHELTHALLLGRALPLWLEEGVTQAMEATVFDDPYPHLTRDEAARHRRFWSREGLTGYWSGASFFRPDDASELSYTLSRTLLRSIRSHGDRKFFEFLARVEHRDLADSASREVYGVPLEHWAAAFLGPGDWSPAEAIARVGESRQD
ncbi:MAG: hypothetical protein AAF488_16220 [Planctomycetota bacterium]